MDRRRFLLTSLAGAVASPRGAPAQPSAKVARIGMLSTTSLEHPQLRAALDEFRQAMADLGHVESRNMVIEHRSAEGRVERYPALAAGLVRLKGDVLIALR